MAGTNLLRIIESARGCKTSLKRRDSTFVYMTQLQLSGRAGRAYNGGYYGRYGIRSLTEGATWTSNASRGRT
jgi:hypothetical protein